jgi:hypothetical protein
MMYVVQYDYVDLDDYIGNSGASLDEWYEMAVECTHAGESAQTRAVGLWALGCIACARVVRDNVLQTYVETLCGWRMDDVSYEGSTHMRIMHVCYEMALGLDAMCLVVYVTGLSYWRGILKWVPEKFYPYGELAPLYYCLDVNPMFAAAYVRNTGNGRWCDRTV